MKDHVLCNGQWWFAVSTSKYVGGDDGGNSTHLSPEKWTVHRWNRWPASAWQSMQGVNGLAISRCIMAHIFTNMSRSVSLSWQEIFDLRVVWWGPWSTKCPVLFTEVKDSRYTFVFAWKYIWYYAFDITHMICAMNEWQQTHCFIYYILASAVSLYDVMNTRTSPPELLWETLH